MAVEETFWERVDTSAGPDGCWPWMGARGRTRNDRYGRVALNGKIRLAHRVAFVLNGGEIAEGHVVMHSCDNPPCCNPAHLSAGTHLDNQRDMWAKGRQNPGFVKGRIGARNEASPAAKFSDAQIAEIRARATGARGEVRGLAREFGISHQHVSEILRNIKRVAA